MYKNRVDLLLEQLTSSILALFEYPNDSTYFRSCSPIFFPKF